MRQVAALLLLVVAGLAQGQTQGDNAANRARLSIALDARGDTPRGVVLHVTFQYVTPSDVPPGIPLVVQGSFEREQKVLSTFRIAARPDQHGSVTTIQTLPAGDITIEARLMIPLEEDAPVLLGKTAKTFSVAATGRPYVASESEGAEGVVAEGTAPEQAGAVRIRPPRRDVAPNLFIVDVEVRPPVTRVEFWVEERKILVRNAAPYRAELDLGKLPRRVEVRAIGYDARGRYVDADAFVVNERDTQLEVKITRTATPDGITHFKLSLQNPNNTSIRSAVLYAGQKKLHEWEAPPYAVDIATSRLAGVEFVRASVVDDTSFEAADLLFLSGDRFIETIEVNVVELPVSVTDASGAPVIDLQQRSFTVLEDGRAQKITAFNFASNLPISVGVVLDHSGSMEKRIATAKAAAIEFFREILEPQDRAFFGAFAFDATRVSPFVSDVSLIEAQVNASPEAVGGTSLYDAIVTGLYRFRSVQGRRALILITDGADTTSRVTHEDMLSYARAARVPLYFVGIGMGVMDVAGTSMMKSMAAETGGVAYFIRDVKDLKETYRKLESELRSQYLIAYSTESSSRDQKYRTVEVKVDRPDARVRTIRGYIP